MIEVRQSRRRSDIEDETKLAPMVVTLKTPWDNKNRKEEERESGIDHVDLVKSPSEETLMRERSQVTKVVRTGKLGVETSQNGEKQSKRVHYCDTKVKVEILALVVGELPCIRATMRL